MLWLPALVTWLSIININLELQKTWSAAALRSLARSHELLEEQALQLHLQVARRFAHLVTLHLLLPVLFHHLSQVLCELFGIKSKAFILVE